MAKLYAKLTSNNKPSRSITADELLDIELYHKNVQLVEIRLILKDDKPVIEWWTNNQHGQHYGTIDPIS